jgi:hypothetical protein
VYAPDQSSALEPGNCVCCQQPTELQEIPVENPVSTK